MSRLERDRTEVGSWVLLVLRARVSIQVIFTVCALCDHSIAVLTLRSSPTALSDVEAASDRPRVRLTTLCVHQALLGLDHGTWLALVVYTKNLASDLKLPALGAYGQGLEKLDLALAIENALGVELWYALDGSAIAARVEVDNFLVGVLEWEDDRVGGEGSKGRVQFLYVG